MKIKTKRRRNGEKRTKKVTCLSEEELSLAVGGRKATKKATKKATRS